MTAGGTQYSVVFLPGGVYKSTLEERAQRLFGTKGIPLRQLDPSSKGLGHHDDKKQRDIAFIEAQVYKYAELLGEQRAASRENVERRLARTADELAEEEGSDDSDLSDVGDASDDEETVPYNPKNLPLGWDGKIEEQQRADVGECKENGVEWEHKYCHYRGGELYNNPLDIRDA